MLCVLCMLPGDTYPWQHRQLLPSFICAAARYFDFDKLAEITQQVTKNLNKIIDINYYPVETARRSNTRNRPIGIGVQVRRFTACYKSWLVLLTLYHGC